VLSTPKHFGRSHWCRKTFIHELFHAISAFSRIPELWKIAKLESDFVEGLTEFFTGYVQYMKYRECYSAWIKSRYPVCAILYEKDVKLFGAIAQVLIPISDFAKIYVFLDNYNMEDFLINKPKKKRKWPSRTLFENMIVKILREKAGENLVDEFRDLLYETP